jgi:hypothetical protein
VEHLSISPSIDSTVSSVWLEVLAVIISNISSDTSTSTDTHETHAVERLVEALIANIPATTNISTTANSNACLLLCLLHPVVILLKAHPYLAVTSCCSKLTDGLIESLVQLTVPPTIDSSTPPPNYALPEEAAKVGLANVVLRDFLLSSTEITVSFNVTKAKRMELHGLIEKCTSYPNPLSHDSTGEGHDRLLVVTKTTAAASASEMAKIKAVLAKRSEVLKLLQSDRVIE